MRNDRDMQAYRDCIFDCGLNDLGFRGGSFTWRRGKSHNTLVMERWEGMLATVQWFDLFPNYQVQHLPIYRSDHSPILLHASHSFEDNNSDIPFKFESLWLSNTDFKRVVEEGWNTLVDGDIVSRIDVCAEHLKSWAIRSFGDIRKQINKTEKNLARAQRCVPDDRMLRNCKEIAEELDRLHCLEESYWFLRARSNELKDGDKTTKYFHHKASSRRRRNTIKGLRNDRGE